MCNVITRVSVIPRTTGENDDPRYGIPVPSAAIRVKRDSRKRSPRHVRRSSHVRRTTICHHNLTSDRVARRINRSAKFEQRLRREWRTKSTESTTSRGIVSPPPYSFEAAFERLCQWGRTARGGEGRGVAIPRAMPPPHPPPRSRICRVNRLPSVRGTRCCLRLRIAEQEGDAGRNRKYHATGSSVCKVASERRKNAAAPGDPAVSRNCIRINSVM